MAQDAMTRQGWAPDPAGLLMWVKVLAGTHGARATASFITGSGGYEVHAFAPPAAAAAAGCP